MPVFPFTPIHFESWMVIGIIAGAVVGGILFIGGIGGYILQTLRPKPPRQEGDRR